MHSAAALEPVTPLNGRGDGRLRFAPLANAASVCCPHSKAVTDCTWMVQAETVAAE